MNKFLKVLAAGAMSLSLVACSSGSTSSKDSSSTSTAAADATAATTEEVGAYADKKVGVCIYQFSDNFMTLFRTELENYLIELGFSKENIAIVDGANDQATQQTKFKTSLLMV